jgi:hypothetical protein
MRFGLRKSAVTPIEDNTVLRQLMKGRDTRWYAGDLLKLNLIIVRVIMDVLSRASADVAVLPPHHLYE